MKTSPTLPPAAPFPKPPLAFALWSLRSRMQRMPEETLELIKGLGFDTVELAGFFDRPTTHLKNDLQRHGFKVCGVHGPSVNLKQERDVNFYTDWARKHLRRFNTNTLAL